MGQMLDLKEELTLMASSCIKGEAVLSRRGIGGLALVGGVVVLAGCDSGSADDGAMSRSSASQAGASVEPTPVEWRPASEVPAVPDLPSRGVRPTSPKGKPLQMYGLTLTVPEGLRLKSGPMLMVRWRRQFGQMVREPRSRGSSLPTRTMQGVV